MKILSLPSSMGLASKIAKYMNCDMADYKSSRFPDNEIYTKIDTPLDEEDVIVIGNTNTDSNIISYLLLLDAAKEQNPKKLIALIPYFGYARQHKVYNKGEAIASKVLAKSIANFADAIIAIELHDEQTLSYISKPFENLKIKNPIYNFFKDKSIDYVVSPDDGGYARSLDMAKLLGCNAYYIDKKRLDANTVEMKLPEVNFNKKNVLLLDDMISTGNTMLSAIDLISDKGANNIYCCAIHGIFAGGSDSKIKDKIDELVVTDTIESEYSKLSVAADVAEYLKSLGF